MALITSPTDMIPDLNYEYHTITVDTLNQTSANTWTCFLTQPLKNVVQARLLAARINTTTATEHCYISIDELNSTFNDRATNVYEGQDSLSVLRKSFASLVTTDDTGIISFRDNYPIAVQYINPIRTLDRLTINIRNEDAILITPPNPAENNFLVLRFVCRKPNL
tara:strand:- start:336 stop:830 length:495 start_codon:yes stop_codon:yes gene_type:complete